MAPRQTQDPFYNLRFITAYDLTMDTRLASGDKRNGIRIGVFHGTLVSRVIRSRKFICEEASGTCVEYKNNFNVFHARFY